jgi:outer membrane receptor protein involved in Fe transport
VTVVVTDRLNCFANAGKAFRAPTFDNLYDDSSFLIGNPDLGPEKGWTYEGDVKYDINRLRMHLSVFHMAYTDKIEIDRSGGYPLTYFDTGDYESTGMEWELGLIPFLLQDGWLRNLSFYTSGYWADPTADDTAGERYQTGPKFQTTVGMKYLAVGSSMSVMRFFLNPAGLRP